MLSSSTTRMLAGAARPASTDASDWFGPIAKPSSHRGDSQQWELYRTSCVQYGLDVRYAGISIAAILTRPTDPRLPFGPTFATVSRKRVDCPSGLWRRIL